VAFANVWANNEGYQWFNLGMALLSGIESRKHCPLWNRMSNLLFKHGDRFYHFTVTPGRCDPRWVTLAESDFALRFSAAETLRSLHGHTRQV